MKLQKKIDFYLTYVDFLKGEYNYTLNPLIIIIRALALQRNMLSSRSSSLLSSELSNAQIVSQSALKTP